MQYINTINICGVCIRTPEYSHEYDGVPYYLTEFKCERTIPKTQKVIEYHVRCYVSRDFLDSTEIVEGGLYAVGGKLVNSKVKGIIDISMLLEYCEAIDEPTPSLKGDVAISGVVTKIFTNEKNYKGFVNFIVTQYDEDGEKRTFSTRIVIWNRLGKLVLDQLKIGDKVLVKGFINNSKTWSKSRSADAEKEEVTVSELLGIYFTRTETEE